PFSQCLSVRNSGKSRRVVSESDPIALRVPRVRSELRARFHRYAAFCELRLDSRHFVRRDPERQKKQTLPDSVHAGSALERALDHQDNPAGVEPDRTQAAVRVEMARDLAQPEHLAIELRNAFHVRRSKRNVVKGTGVHPGSASSPMPQLYRKSATNAIT